MQSIQQVLYLDSRVESEISSDIGKSFDSKAFRDVRLKIRCSSLFEVSNIFSKAGASKQTRYEVPMASSEDYFVIEFKPQAKKANEIDMMQEVQITTLATRHDGSRFIRVVGERVCAIAQMPTNYTGGHRYVFEHINGNAFFFWYLSAILQHCRASFEAGEEPRPRDFIGYLLTFLVHVCMMKSSEVDSSTLASLKSVLSRCPRGLRSVLSFIYSLSRLFVGETDTGVFQRAWKPRAEASATASVKSGRGFVPAVSSDLSAVRRVGSLKGRSSPDWSVRAST